MKNWMVVFLLAWVSSAFPQTLPVLRVGSKSFTEGFVLSEIVAQVIEGAGEATVERSFGLGQTGIAFEALRNRKIDLYPEYTGTISEAILKDPSLVAVEAIRRALQKEHLTISESLGFNNTYALAVKRSLSLKLGLKKIEDLLSHPELRAGLSEEFVNREDGYPKLSRVYGLNFANLRSLSHALAYEALASDKTDLMDIYTTDAKVRKYDLVALQDTKGVFPKYLAVLLARESLTKDFPKTWAALRRLEGRIQEAEMVRLNAAAELDMESFHDIAQKFLKRAPTEAPSYFSELWKLTKEHVDLVLISLIASILIGLPAAIFAFRFPTVGQFILILTGTLQTIPSLALFCFLIPYFGIGRTPALIALCLYGLLPIVRNTYVGLSSIDPKLREVARTLGLSQFKRLTKIYLPLASPSIMAGIRTSAIINVGTTTLAALIGAGGYGAPIVRGLVLNDTHTILEGAIPAAVMAIAMHGVFEILDRLAIPRGIRN
jgi:osmoprotectant transport system permease protein